MPSNPNQPNNRPTNQPPMTQTGDSVTVRLNLSP